MTDGRMMGNGQMSRRDALGMLIGAGVAARLGWVGPTGDPALLRRRIPGTEELLPVVGLGTWQTFDVGESSTERRGVRDVLARFAARRARLVDSSPMYGRAESVVGELAAELGIRPSLFLATKVFTSGREAGVAQMERSTQRLGGRPDLIQVHNLIDVETHLQTLGEWKASDRVRYVGVTHYVSDAFAEIERLLRTRQLDFVQFNYSIADRDAERSLLGTAADRGVAVIINRPFGGSALFGHVRGKKLPSWAAEIGCASWAQFFLKFILGHPAVTCVIPATANVEHLDDDLGAGLNPLPDEATRRRMVGYFEGL
jgi:aryl-alcohol dehydrogenase-like predicted oxidoreductase